MKILKPSCEIIEQAPGMVGALKHVEKVGRTCYVPDTEVLTDKGWKKIQDIDNINDKVLTYDSVRNSLVWDYPNVLCLDYNDDIIEVNHPNIKFSVTKDHRIYQSVPNSRNYSFISAAQMAGLEKIPYSRQCRFRIPKYFTGSNRGYLSIQKYTEKSLSYSKEIKHGYRQSTLESINVEVNIDFITILGAFIAEGHTFHGEKYRSGSYCQITQDCKSVLYTEVLIALNNLGWSYNIDYDRRKPDIKWIKFGTNQCWVEFFDNLCGRGSRNKHLPEWWRELPDFLLNRLLYCMYLGDGSHNKTRNEKYLSVSHQLLEEVQECFILLGKNGTVNYDTDVFQKCYFEESLRDSWIIDRNKHISIVPYSGKVYCTSTKSGIICIRYKGKTCWCGNCYKSEDKTTDDSHIRFVDMLIENGHLAMLEHATIYLTIPIEREDLIDIYKNNPYSRVVTPRNDQYAYITTNSRVIIENDWQCDMNYMVPAPTKHAIRVTVKFSTQIAVSREANRHRVNSMAEQSTRYCNYSKDKFDNEISISLPSWINEDNLKLCEGSNTLSSLCEDISTSNTSWWTALEYWWFANKACEFAYMGLIKQGWTPEKARTVLPLDTLTELVHTAYLDDWQHFIDLRYHGKTGKPHPDAYEIASMLYKEFKQLKYVK